VRILNRKEYTYKKGQEKTCPSCNSYVLFPKNRSWGRCNCPEDERHSCYTDNGDVL